MPKKRRHLTTKYLERRKIPKVLIAGLVLASVLGWTGWKNLDRIKNYYQIKAIFPTQTKATAIIDGDTLLITNGLTLRLVGIDAPGRGDEGYDAARDYLTQLVANKKLTLEYDAYQDDKFGRILAYVWIPCDELVQAYCHGDRALVNEIMLKKRLARKIIYEKRKRLKYEDYLQP